jgi:hypothetical protein
MTINVTLNNVADLTQTTTAQTTINNNNSAITTGFVSAYNTTGDQLLGTMDANSNQIINLPAPSTANSPVRLQDISTTPSLGTVVTTTATQTLTNKSISGGQINSGTVSGSYMAATNLAAGNVNGGVSGVLPIANGGTGQSVVSTSWTPTDQSGASLTFTAVNTQWAQIGNFIFVYGTFTYPSTASSANAIVSLPVFVPNQTYAGVYSSVVGAGNNIFFKTVPNTSTMAAINAAGTATINSVLSSKVISFIIIYPAS